MNKNYSRTDAKDYFSHIEGRKELELLTIEADFSQLPRLEEIILEGDTVRIKQPALIREHSDG